LKHFALSVCAAIVMIAGCGGSQPPIGAPGAMPQMPAVASHTRVADKSVETLFSFDVKDGSEPTGLVAVKGVLYGLTETGGPYDAGTAFSLTTSGKESVLYYFGSGADGQNPVGAPILVDGNYYGVTEHGGANSLGTVFSLSPSGKQQWLYSFGAEPGGSIPTGGLVVVDGTLYGTTAEGGKSGCLDGCGTVFKITTSGKEDIIHKFTGTKDGRFPNAPLMSDGSELYGTAEEGGEYDWGTLFKVSIRGAEITLHSFGPSSDGDGLFPGSSPALFQNELYGTAGGGEYGQGAIYKASLKGKERVLYSFVTGGPNYALVPLKGNLYGTTVGGGAHGYGTIFELTPSGKVTVLYSFGANVNRGGVGPNSPMIVLNGSLYGTTSGGGKNHGGTVFTFTP
jgi:uncharacterized repeat protein (TIGR03803 family)